MRSGGPSAQVSSAVGCGDCGQRRAKFARPRARCIAGGLAAASKKALHPLHLAEARGRRLLDAHGPDLSSTIWQRTVCCELRALATYHGSLRRAVFALSGASRRNALERSARRRIVRLQSHSCRCQRRCLSPVGTARRLLHSYGPGSSFQVCYKYVHMAMQQMSTDSY